MTTNRRHFTKLFTGGSVALAAGSAPGEASTPKPGSRIRKVEVLPVGIQFRTQFKIGVGTVGGKAKPGRYVMVRAETEDGHVGWGMTLTIPAWSYETIEAVVGTLRHYLAPMAIGRTPFEWNALKKQMDETIRPAVSNGAPFAKSALEMAFMDLAGQVAGVPVHRLLGGKIRETVEFAMP